MEHAFTILSWLEHLPREDTPPRWMWHLDHELDAWFERVRERYESGRPADDDSGPGMEDNALYDEWMRRHGAA